jgi:hypothetical protein
MTASYAEEKLADTPEDELDALGIGLTKAGVVNALQRLTKRGLIRPGSAPTKIDSETGAPATALLSVKSRWVDISPEKAAAWLANNFRNRPVVQDVIDAYARDMSAGVWIPTHQGIAFNNREELIDGQHRLMAIVKAQRTVRMMVTYNLPAEIEGHEMTTMDAIDRGRTRTVADQLKIQHGLKDAPLITHITQSLAALCFGERTRRLSVSQTLMIYREFAEEITWLIEHRSRSYGLRMKGVTAGFAFAMAALRGVSDDMLRDYYHDLIYGKEIDGRRPLALLYTFLTSDQAQLLSRSTDRALSELVLHAIYLEIKGEPATELEHTTTGADHFRELQSERVEKIANLFKLPQ